MRIRFASRGDGWVSTTKSPERPFLPPIVTKKGEGCKGEFPEQAHSAVEWMERFRICWTGKLEAQNEESSAMML